MGESRVTQVSAAEVFPRLSNRGLCGWGSPSLVVQLARCLLRPTSSKWMPWQSKLPVRLTLQPEKLVTMHRPCRSFNNPTQQVRALSGIYNQDFFYHKTYIFDVLFSFSEILFLYPTKGKQKDKFSFLSSFPPPFPFSFLSSPLLSSFLFNL